MRTVPELWPRRVVMIIRLESSKKARQLGWTMLLACVAMAWHGSTVIERSDTLAPIAIEIVAFSICFVVAIISFLKSALSVKRERATRD